MKAQLGQLGFSGPSLPPDLVPGGRIWLGSKRCTLAGAFSAKGISPPHSAPPRSKGGIRGHRERQGASGGLQATHPPALVSMGASAAGAKEASAQRAGSYTSQTGRNLLKAGETDFPPSRVLMRAKKDNTQVNRE